MLYRLEMHIVHMRHIIRFIPDQMFPKAALPKAVLAPAHMHSLVLFAIEQQQWRHAAIGKNE